MLLVSLLTVVSCFSGGDRLIVGSISGPAEIAENSSAEYSVTVSDDTGITYSWIANPVETGQFSARDRSTVIFTASEVWEDTPIDLRVVVTSDHSGPVIREFSIVILNSTEGVQEAPVAAAHSDMTVINPGMTVEFCDDSTDPNGSEDIVKREWDFDYKTVDGFTVDSEEIQPSYIYQELGTFFVQLRVTDISGLSDLLDQPIEIQVVNGPVPPVAAAHPESYFPEVGHSTHFLDDSYDPNVNGAITKWEWDFSYVESEGFNVESEDQYPQMTYLEITDYSIQLRVTNSNGLTDMLDEPILIGVVQQSNVITWGWAWDTTVSDIALDKDGNILVLGEDNLNRPYLKLVNRDLEEDMFCDWGAEWHEYKRQQNLEFATAGR